MHQRARSFGRRGVAGGLAAALCLVGILGLATNAASASSPPHVTTIPISGAPVPPLSAYDDAMTQMMQIHGVSAGILAVVHHGVVVLEHGYGWHDAARTVALEPSALLRIASDSKLVTESAIGTLENEGVISASSRVFCVAGGPVPCILHIDPAPGHTVDARLQNITVQNLLDHKGGWSSTVAGGFQVVQAAQDLGVPTPATPEQLVEWSIGQPLQNDPGSTYTYANFGYMVLSLVVAAVSGESYIDFARAHVLSAVGTTDMTLAHDLQANDDPREPYYFDPNSGPSIYDQSKTVSLADGATSIAGLLGGGGLISSARAYSKFIATYYQCACAFFGSLPGNIGVADMDPDHDTYIFAALNQRQATGESFGDYNDELYNDLHAVTPTITTWPTVDDDTTAPAITATAKTSDGKAYSPNTPTNLAVTVHFTCTDGGSGVASCPANKKFTPPASGIVAHTALGTSTDKAGNTSGSAPFGPVVLVGTGSYSSRYSASERKSLQVDTAYLHESQAAAQHDAALLLVYLTAVIRSEGGTPPVLGDDPGSGSLKVTSHYTAPEHAALQAASPQLTSDPPTVQRYGVMLLAYIVLTAHLNH